MKTIRMAKATLDKWLAALRSGKYTQGKGALETKDIFGKITHCCLGVLQIELDGEVERPAA